MNTNRRTREDWLPRSERREVDLRAFALGRGRRVADVVLSDLSYEGCQLRSAEKFKPGERLELRVMRLGVIQAEVCWCAKGRAGARFLG